MLGDKNRFVFFSFLYLFYGSNRFCRTENVIRYYVSSYFTYENENIFTRVDNWAVIFVYCLISVNEFGNSEIMSARIRKYWFCLIFLFSASMFSFIVDSPIWMHIIHVIWILFTAHHIIPANLECFDFRFAFFISLYFTIWLLLWECVCLSKEIFI